MDNDDNLIVKSITFTATKREPAPELIKYKKRKKTAAQIKKENEWEEKASFFYDNMSNEEIITYCKSLREETPRGIDFSLAYYDTIECLGRHYASQIGIPETYTKGEVICAVSNFMYPDRAVDIHIMGKDLDDYVKNLEIIVQVAPLEEKEVLDALSESEAINFVKMLQGKATNALTKVRTNNLLEQVNKLGTAEIKVDNSFTLRIKEYKSLINGVPTTAYMLLDCFLIHFTEQPIKDVRIRLPLKKYMEMRGLSDTKNAREQVLRDMKALQLIEYEAKEKIRGKWQNSGNISIYGGTGIIRNGIIHFNFNVDFFNALLNYRVMDYSKETLRLNPKQHPHAYYFSRYIDENYRLNEGKERVNIITIETLITKTPLLPSYDEIMQSPSHRGNIYKYIIEPVIRDLDSIERLFYDFITPEGATISDPLTLFKGAGGYTDFISSKIKIDYNDYEQHNDRVQRRKNHVEKARKINNNKKKNKELEERITALELVEKGGTVR